MKKYYGTRQSVLNAEVSSLSLSVRCDVSVLFCSRRALAMFNREERAKRENQILSDFRSMVHNKVSKQQKP